MPGQHDFRLNQIGQISVPVRDVERASAFYRDKLGMRHLFTVPHLAFFDCGGVRLMLSRPETPEFDHPSSIIYFKVDDIDVAYQTLSGRNIHFEDAPHVIANMEPTISGWHSFATRRITTWGS